MAELITVRHAQASFGADDYDQLSPLGWRQARWLGEHWRQQGIRFERIMCGDMRRHKETVKAICEGLALTSLTVEEYPQLNEFDFEAVLTGYLELYPQEAPRPDAGRADFFRLLKRAMGAWAREEFYAEESWSAFGQRIAEALALLGDAPRGSRTLVVSSGGAIAMMVGQVMSAPVDTVIGLNLQISNTAVTRFFASSRDAGIGLHSFNHVPHLDREERRDFITYS